MLISLLAFVVAIGILVTIHELGHYWVARRCDVKVLRFSVGFGKPLWMRRFGKDRTEWVVAAVPLGGFVRMADERDEEVRPEDRSRAFNNKPVVARMCIVLAGPVANFLLAGFFYWLLFVVGTPGAKPYVAAPSPGSVAAAAGFAEYDLLLTVDGQSVRTWGDAKLRLLDRASTRGTATIDIETRGGVHRTLALDMATLDKSDLDGRDFLAKLGMRSYRLPVAPVIGGVIADGAAAEADLRSGDRIVSVDGQGMTNWEELVGVVSRHPGLAVRMAVERDGRLLDVRVTPRPVTEQGRTIGRIGVRPQIDPAAVEALSVQVRYGPFDAAAKAAAKVWDMSLFSLKMLGRMVTGDVSWKNLSGPITIADYAGQSAELGWIAYVNFLALISVSLGVLNLLPIPVLDGGQLVYHIAELIKGRPVSPRSVEIGQQFGLAVLICLTAFALFNDLQRLFTS